MNKQKISFQFGPNLVGNSTYSVEKSINGIKHRYVEGIASGTSIDGHGERMTQHAINSFMRQANSGDILLYADVHGIRASEDIGILETANVMPNGDWFVSFRLYDSSDGVASRNLEVADMIWKQINGLPPYKMPKEKGFSVEGCIPDGSIKEITADGKRTIDDIELEGVVIVPKPAYKPSVANAVMKALDTDQLIAPMLVNKSSSNEYMRRLQIQDAFEEKLDEVLKSNDPKRINSLFKEYQTLILGSVGVKEALSNGSNHNVAQKSIMSSLKEQYELLSGIRKNNQVRKGNMLSPDESALLQNIKSLLDQLGQLNAGAQSVAGTSPQDQAMITQDPLNNSTDTETGMEDNLEGMPMDDQDPTKVGPPDGEGEDEVAKADQDGTQVTGEETAENKAADATTELTEDNIKVLKSMVDALEKKAKAGKQVAKSFGSDPMLLQLSNSVVELSKVMKSINDRQKSTETAIAYILDGMGVVSAVKKSQEKPVLTAPTNTGHPSQVTNIVQKSQGQQKDFGRSSIANSRDEVRKSLGDSITDIFGNASTRSGRF